MVHAALIEIQIILHDVTKTKECETREFLKGGHEEYSFY
jgi:hypothetical protein